MGAASVAGQLIADLRSRLLDLRNSNKLLSYKHSERSKSQVRLVDEQPNFLHECLTTGQAVSFRSLPEPEGELPDEKDDVFLMALDVARRLDLAWVALAQQDEDIASQQMARLDRQIRDRVRLQLGLPPAQGGKLTSIADWARLHGIEPSFELPSPSAESGGEDKHLDSEIQTLLLPDQMQGKLAGVMDQARTALQEMGVNVLHVAVGFLEWFESPTAEKPMLAPLLLYPAEIERRPMKGKGQYRYFLRGEQEPIINITLRERLAKDFNLIVPELQEGETAETYMARMAKVIAEHPRWRVRRYATVGLFSFSRLVMYNDLDPARWGGEGGLPTKGTLEQLFGHKEAKDPKPESHDLEDPLIEAEVPLLIRDADSSQHQAIIDVMRERSLVIKGPPGTGKSQTIANIIAASLAKKKTVLFVAEKAAALDVVKKRLDEAGLGEFCFELHSTKAKKAEVLAGLDKRLNLTPEVAPSSVEAALSELRTLRSRLAKHATTMNLPFGALEVRGRSGWRPVTIHDIIWAEQYTRAAPPRFPGIDRVSLLNSMETTRFDAERRKDRLSAIERVVGQIINEHGSVAAHPWSFVSRGDIQVLDVSDIVDAAELTRTALSAAISVSDQVASLGIAVLPNALGYSQTGAALSGLPSVDPALDDRLLKSILTEERGPHAVSLANLLEEKQRLEAERNSILIGDKWHIDLVPDLARRATELKIGGITLQTLVERIGSVRQEAAQLDNVANVAKRLLSLLGLKGGLTPRLLRRCIACLDMLETADRSALLARLPSVLEETSHPIIERAYGRAVDLRQRDAAIRERFVVESNVTVMELRRHATVLRSTGFLGKFGSEFKTVKRTALSLVKAAGATVEEQLAEFLIELADHLEERQAFEGDLTLRTVCAHRFAGLDTDLDALRAACKFAGTVRIEFAGIDEPERSLRRFLLDAEIEVLDGLRALGKDDRFSALRAAVSQARALDEDIELHAEALARWISEAEAIRVGLLATGLKPSCTPDMAGTLPALLSRLNEIEAELSFPMVASIVGLESQLPAPQALRACLNMADRLTVSVPAQTISVICGMRGTLSENVRHLQALGRSLFERVTVAGNEVQKFVGQVTDAALLETVQKVFWEQPAEEIVRILAGAAAAPDDLMQWVTLRRGIRDGRDDGMAPVFAAYDDAGEDYLGMVDAYERVLNRSLARKVMELHPELGQTSALSLDDIRTRFRDLDQRIEDMRRQLLIAELAATPIPQGIQSPRKGECTEATLIRNEIAKKKRHIPIRDLVERASSAIRAMKPCVMMSPPSVAQFLKPGQVFDLLIIDEASQMRPEEAISALARARQAVIVGDPQQLPPSSFFDRQDAEEQEDDQEEFEKVVAESVLDVARTAFQPIRELLWHYRSRYGALIAFSNRHFYDDRLIVFPSPLEGQPEHGVKLVPIAGQYRASVNIPEAQAIAFAALDFMGKHPDKSLGIVALNQPQRDLILAEMDRLFVRNAIAERYRTRWHGTLEPFFVKNLENVQGDERDVIFISTVYGPDEKGNLMHRFGPINGAAGDRRLNVLFSRAKHGVTVFSSMRPDQIRADGAPRGTRLLKEYLQYAATGKLDSGHVPFSECESDFERFVKERLEQRGYEVVAQVGVAGFRIDLGIKHPTWPYGFLLGIECDGAAYHSSLSARDRDRLRQQVLESLGWTIYRVWSTDWFRDQNRELAKLVSFIEKTLAECLSRHAEQAAKNAAWVQESDAALDSDDEEDAEVVSAEHLAAAEDLEEEIGDVQGTHTGFQEGSASNEPLAGPTRLGAYEEAKFADLDLILSKERFFDPDYEAVLFRMIERGIVVEGPIRDDVLARRIASAHGFGKAGARIRGHIAGLARQLFDATKEGDDLYFWPTDCVPDRWATFRRSKGEPRPIDEIAIQELRALALIALQDRRSGTEDVLVVMSRIAGLQRLRAASRERLAKAHKKAVQAMMEPAE